MGFFSWITSDTKRSIPNVYQHTHPTFPVHMITEDGRVFTETEYEGYGVFGGKDFYVLAAELNGFKGATDDETRRLFFDKIWKRGIKNGGKVLVYREDFTHYEAKVLVEGIEGEVTPNQLLREYGWEDWDVSKTGNVGGRCDTQGFVNAGFKMPKIEENLPKDIVKEWDSIPYPESCPDQGYFYCDEDDDDDDDDDE